MDTKREIMTRDLLKLLKHLHKIISAAHRQKVFPDIFEKPPKREDEKQMVLLI